MAKYSVTEAELLDGTLGICEECGHIQDGVEPDAVGYECESCGRCCVCGLQEMLIVGTIDIK